MRNRVDLFSLSFADILLKLLVQASRSEFEQALVSSGIIESLTHLMSSTQDPSLVQEVLRLLINAMDQS